MKISLNFEEIQEKEIIRASVDLDGLSSVRNTIKRGHLKIGYAHGSIA
jgi:hypothetical protein